MGIQKVAKNKYRVRYFAGYNSEGKRVYPSKTFKTRKDANTWLTARLREKHLGEYAEASSLTLSQYLDQWLMVKKQSLRENTLYSYRGYVENYVRPELGKMKLTAIKPSHVEQWQARLLAKISPRTVSCVRVMLGGLFIRAVRTRLLTNNPVRDAEAVKWKRPTMKCFTPEQANTFLAEREGRVGLLLALMLSTGLRPEEMIGLRWSDLSLDGSRGQLRVRQILLRIPNGGGWRFDTPKSKSSVRTVGFPSSLAAELKEYRKAQLEDRMKAGRHYQDHDLVFASPVGAPLGRCPIVDEFKRTLERAGLPAIRLYDLRHSFVTLSLAAGVDPKTVSDEAGHASVAFTLDHYGHVLNVMREGAVDKREAFLAAHKTASR